MEEDWDSFAGYSAWIHFFYLFLTPILHKCPFHILWAEGIGQERTLEERRMLDLMGSEKMGGVQGNRVCPWVGSV